jgi:hypothetical protein
MAYNMMMMCHCCGGTMAAVVADAIPRVLRSRLEVLQPC